MYSSTGHLGGSTGESIAMQVGQQAVKYAVQYGADLLGFASFATPIGIAIGFIGALIGLLMRKTPTFPIFHIGLALPKDNVPTVGSCLLAASHFKVLTPQDPTLPAEGAIVVAIDVEDFPTAITQIKQSEPQIAGYQQKMLTPFFISMLNLTPERQLAMSNTLMHPPLQDDFTSWYVKYGLNQNYRAWDIGSGEMSASIETPVKQAYFYFITTLNDAFLRRIYRSIIDSPALTTEEYGQIVGDVPSSLDTGGNVTEPQPSITDLPATTTVAVAPSTNWLPLLALGGLALYATKGR